MEEVSPAVALLSQKPIWNSQGSWESCWVKATATSNTQLKIPTASIRFRRLRVLFLVEDDVSVIPRILQSPTNSLIHGRFNPQSTAHFFGVFNSPGGSQFPVLRDTSSFHLDYLVFGTNSFCAFALNLAVFLLVGKTSAGVAGVAGVAKDWLLIAFSWSVIKDTVTPINLFGYGIAFLGVAYYNHAKLRALKAKEAQKSAQQSDEESGRLLEEKEGGRKNEPDN
ncbi:hypothetical protein IGI04_024386 [Brassica rapa subsp. trilocularis]|uniref:Sugar phosphate transporter domain-containing protein n=2 Tax=Brassica TaxID=3705 RepID=A0ABQ8D239_BRANA|nr:hypothetical protein IGI04_024386 [Brassica rapa subsp. trilocularis]KAH0923428.1 hypothetical protein HID58_023446 [Brassica napus]